MAARRRRKSVSQGEEIELSGEGDVGLRLRLAGGGRGVIVSFIEKNSMAERSSMRVGDTIQAVNGTIVVDVEQALSLLQRNNNPAQTLRIRVHREVLVDVPAAQDGGSDTPPETSVSPPRPLPAPVASDAPITPHDPVARPPRPPLGPPPPKIPLEFPYCCFGVHDNAAMAVYRTLEALQEEEFARDDIISDVREALPFLVDHMDKWTRPLVLMSYANARSSLPYEATPYIIDNSKYMPELPGSMKKMMAKQGVDYDAINAASQQSLQLSAMSSAGNNANSPGTPPGSPGAAAPLAPAAPAPSAMAAMDASNAALAAGGMKVAKPGHYLVEHGYQVHRHGNYEVSTPVYAEVPYESPGVGPDGKPLPDGIHAIVPNPWEEIDPKTTTKWCCIKKTRDPYPPLEVDAVPEVVYRLMMKLVREIAELPRREDTVHLKAKYLDLLLLLGGDFWNARLNLDITTLLARGEINYRVLAMTPTITGRGQGCCLCKLKVPPYNPGIFASNIQTMQLLTGENAYPNQVLRAMDTDLPKFNEAYFDALCPCGCLGMCICCMPCVTMCDRIRIGAALDRTAAEIDTPLEWHVEKACHHLCTCCWLPAFRLHMQAPRSAFDCSVAEDVVVPDVSLDPALVGVIPHLPEQNPAFVSPFT